MRRLHCSAGCADRCQQSRSRFACAVIAVVNAVRTKWVTLITVLCSSSHWSQRPGHIKEDPGIDQARMSYSKHFTASSNRYRPMSARRSSRCRLVQIILIISILINVNVCSCAVVHAQSLAVNTSVHSTSKDLHSKVIVGHIYVRVAPQLTFTSAWKGDAKPPGR